MATILVTNDDGIDGPGLRAVTAALAAAGHIVRVVAPDSDYSGAGGSLLSMNGPSPGLDRSKIAYTERTLEEAPGVEAYALDGPPALCVMLAMRGAFGGRPDFVMSGINFGLNVGPAVLHSGTVSAALTAGAAGVAALAVSSEFSPDKPDEMRYDTAAELALMVMNEQIDSDHRVVSLNVPRCALHEIAGVRSAALAPVSGWRSTVESWGDGVVNRSYRPSGEPVSPDSDAGLARAGFATITALAPITGVDCDDLVVRVEASAT